MFGGEVREVTLRGNSDSIGIIYDRFGRDIFVVQRDENSFSVTVNVAVSPQFYSWIFGLGDLLTIEGPDDVVKEYCEMCQKAINNCKK